MNKAKLIFLILPLVMIFLLAPAVTTAESAEPISEEYLREAIDCISQEIGEKLIAKYEKLSDTNPYKYLYLGIVYHNLVSIGKAELSKALEINQKAVEKTGHPLASGYYGSTMNMQASDYYKKGDLMNAMGKLQEGMEIMDKAVAQGPENVDLRVLRIINSYVISRTSPINRFDKIKEDLAFLKQKYENLPIDLKSFYNLYSGTVAQEDNDLEQAAVFFEKAIKCAPQSRYAKIAQLRMEKLKQQKSKDQ